MSGSEGVGRGGDAEGGVVWEEDGVITETHQVMAPEEAESKRGQETIGPVTEGDFWGVSHLGYGVSEVSLGVGMSRKGVNVVHVCVYHNSKSTVFFFFFVCNIQYIRHDVWCMMYKGIRGGGVSSNVGRSTGHGFIIYPELSVSYFCL